MRLIRITFRDGTVKEWHHEGRSGGSYTKTLSLEPDWATVRDEYMSTESFPRDLIAKIETKE